MRRFAVHWLPVLVWMTVIFTASGDRHSNEHSSRLIGPLIRWLSPALSAAEVEEAVFIVRKIAHVTEYSILAMLLWRARRRSVRDASLSWNGGHAWFAWIGCVIYASSDEIHQLLVPAREGTVHDVLIDSCGAALGLLIVWSVGRWRRRW